MNDIQLYQSQREEEAILLLDVLSTDHVTEDEYELITEKIEGCLEEIQLCRFIEEQIPTESESPEPNEQPKKPTQQALIRIQEYGGPQSVNYQHTSQLVKGAIVGQYDSEDPALHLQKLLQQEGVKATVKDSMYGRKRIVVLVLE